MRRGAIRSWFELHCHDENERCRLGLSVKNALTFHVAILECDGCPD